MNEASETEETRRAMAEAIVEMEREEGETRRVLGREERGRNDGMGKTRTEAAGPRPPANVNEREE